MCRKFISLEFENDCDIIFKMFTDSKGAEFQFEIWRLLF